MTAFEPTRIFEALRVRNVDYVVIGAIAMAAHGVVRATTDVDIVPDTAPDNLERLAAAIADLGGAPHGEPETAVTVELLGRDANMRFDTEVGQLDVMCADRYRRVFRELRGRAERLEVDGAELIVASRNDLIILKAGSGRDRDLLDIGDLLASDE